MEGSRSNAVPAYRLLLLINKKRTATLNDPIDGRIVINSTLYLLNIQGVRKFLLQNSRACKGD